MRRVFLCLGIVVACLSVLTVAVHFCLESRANAIDFKIAIVAIGSNHTIPKDYCYTVYKDSTMTVQVGKLREGRSEKRMGRDFMRRTDYSETVSIPDDSYQKLLELAPYTIDLIKRIRSTQHMDWQIGVYHDGTSARFAYYPNRHHQNLPGVSDLMKIIDKLTTVKVGAPQ